MHICWLGNTAIKILTKASLDEESVVLIDPYKPKEGASPRSLSAHLVLYTHGEKDSIALMGSPVVLAHPGEIETRSVLVQAVAGKEQNKMIVRIDAEGISLGHLGVLAQQLSNAQIDTLSGVDVLFVPVGGKDTGVDIETIIKIISMIEPRVVIPMNYKSDNAPQALGVEQFLKEIGTQPRYEEKKLILKKKDLPEEDMQVVVVSKE